MGRRGAGASRPGHRRAGARERAARRVSSWSTGTQAFRGIHAPEIDGRAATRPDAGWCSTSCCACSSRSCCASGPSSASRWASRHDVDGDARAAVPRALPFPLTGAQRAGHRARSSADLAGAPPMHRLLQGDVGRRQDGRRGLRAAGRRARRTPGRADGADRGARRAARPRRPRAARRLHGARRRDAVRASGRCASSCSRTAPPRRSAGACWRGLADGDGRHPHRHARAASRKASSFAVARRRRHRRAAPLRRRAAGRAARRRARDGAVPDVLVMTATPIPRTAAMTVYGDLDVSRPRRDAAGAHADRDRRGRAASSRRRRRGTDVRAEVAAGHQAYVVCPLIEESEKLEVGLGARRRSSGCTAGELDGLRLGLLHGRMPRRRRRRSMSAFRVGRGRRAGRDDRDRGRRRRAERDRDGDPRRRPVRHRAAAPAPRSGRPGRGRVDAAAWSATAHAEVRRPASRPSCGRPTGSSWPRSTSTCAAKARSWGSARRVATT